MFFLDDETPILLSIALMVFLLAITAGANWRGLKQFLANIEEHYIEILDGTLFYYQFAQKSEIDLSQVTELVINRKRDNVSAIMLRCDKANLARLEHYERMDEIVAMIMAAIPGVKVREKRWLHS